MGLDGSAGSRPVWLRRDVHTTVCPKPLLDSQSLAWIEGFVIHRVLGLGIGYDTPAKDVDAFLLLAQLVEKERLATQQATDATSSRGNQRTKC
jgi:hypothetical protein